jgi:16S rRNA (cytidine1402-2'-O)-methyltransferase
MPLYILPTPIGNLRDITIRVLDTLKDCNYVLCEDTRKSKQLFSHYEIKTPLKSFYKDIEFDRTPRIIEDLKSGLKIGLISSAGTPIICDPGAELVKNCIKYSIEISVLPGPCAFITAFVGTGFLTNGFTFIGFFPKKTQDQNEILSSITMSTTPVIFYESPHRIQKTLKALIKHVPNRIIHAAKELTKMYEKAYQGTPQNILDDLISTNTKGEWVIIVSATTNDTVNEIDQETIIKQINLLKNHIDSPSEMTKIICSLTSAPKNTVYKLVLKQKEN